MLLSHLIFHETVQLCSYKRDTSIIMEDEEEERLVKRSRALTELKLGVSILDSNQIVQILRQVFA